MVFVLELECHGQASDWIAQTALLAFNLISETEK